MKAEMTLKGSQFYQTSVAPSTSSTIATVGPSLFTRAALAASIFEFFRFTRLSWKLMPSWNVTTSASPQASQVIACVSYYPEEITAGHTGTTISLVDASENEGAALVTCSGISNNAAPTSSCTQGTSTNVRGRAPRRVLLNVPLKWYITDATGEDDNVQQGILIWAVAPSNSSSETTLINVQFDYTIEFAGRSTTGLSLAVKLKQPLRDDDEKSSDESLVVVKRSLGRLKAPSVKGPR